MVVYADLFLLINWVADFVLLKVITNRQPVSKTRISTAAFIGSTGALVMLYIPFGFRIPGSLLLAVLMILCVNNGRWIKRCIHQLVSMYVYGFLISGFVQTLYQWVLLSSKHIGERTICAISLWILLIGICYLCIRFYWNRFGHTITERQLLEMIIYWRGKQFPITGMVDTGHTLKEKQTGFSVIIVEYREEWSAISMASGTEKIYWIPYQTASSRAACMLGFQPDAVQWKDGMTKEIIIAVSKLHQLDPHGQYNAILSPETLAG